MFLNLSYSFSWANDNQMPIREIKIDWGDTIDEYPTWVKNRKSACSGSTFGDSTEGCRTDSWNFVYDFHCSTGTPGWNSECPNGVNNACCFKPTISITDNWGKQATGSFNGVIVVYP